MAYGTGNGLGTWSGGNSQDFAQWFAKPENEALFKAKYENDSLGQEEFSAGLEGTGPLGTDTGMSGMDKAKLGLGGLNTIMQGVQLFGEGGAMDLGKERLKGLEQQRLSNADIIQTRKNRATDISGAFGRRPGLGA